MYNNLGKKLQILSTVLGILFGLVGIIAWAYFISNNIDINGEKIFIKEDDWLGWVSLAAGILAYFGSWFLYGFGQLVGDMRYIAYKSFESRSDTVPLRENPKPPVVDKNLCPNCGTVKGPHSEYCMGCGWKF